MLDPFQQGLRDLRVGVHESGHLAVLVLLAPSARPVRVVAGRHHALEDGEAGSVEWLGELTPFDHATVLFAGRIAAEDLDALVWANTSDERKALEVCPLGWEKARARAWTLLERRDVQSAVRELTAALWDAPDRTLPGSEAAAIVRKHIRPEESR